MLFTGQNLTPDRLRIVLPAWVLGSSVRAHAVTRDGINVFLVQFGLIVIDTVASLDAQGLDGLEYKAL